MIAPADPYLAAFAEAGCDIITVHAEAGPHLDRSLQAIRAPRQEGRRVAQPGDAGKRHRICARPARPVLLMTVNPGFGGQAFIPADRRQGAAREGDDRRPADPPRGRRRRRRRRPRRWSPRPAPTCWSPARRSSRAEPKPPIAPISPPFGTPPTARSGRRPKAGKHGLEPIRFNWKADRGSCPLVIIDGHGASA